MRLHIAASSLRTVLICRIKVFCPRITGLLRYYSSSVIIQCFSFQTNVKNLVPSYKMALDLWDCLERVKLVIQKSFKGLIKLFVVIPERGKPHLIAE